MEEPPEDPAEEIRRLRRCLNDLVSVLALPAIWTGGDPAQIVRTLVDALLGMLRLDLVYVRLKEPVGEAPLEVVRLAQARGPTGAPGEISATLSRWLEPDPQTWNRPVRMVIGGAELSIMPLRLGMQGEIGVIVAGSERADFPGQTERLLLSVAANQAAIGLQGARLLGEQKRVADELDHRVAQRTAELAAVNEALTKEIAERRLAEEELRRSEAFLAEAQHLSSTGSFAWRVSSNEITWSEELYRIFEFDQDQPVTLERIFARIHPEDLALSHDLIDRARVAGSDFEFEHRLQMPDQAVKYLHMVAHGLRDQDGQLEYIGAIQDVTERRLSEEALGNVRSELAHMARVTSLGTLTASIAHEVNQPLAAIVTNASTCLRMLATDPPNIDAARETVRRTIRDGNRAADVVQRLRTLFAKKGTAADPVDLNEAAREVIALSLSELQRSRVMLRSEFADDLPAVTGDRVQLQQVILNLLLNAAEAMSGVDDRPRQLLVRTHRDQADHVCLTVQDAGIGFDPQTLGRLFEAFYTTKSSGMGIGLSVSRSIIESHNGRLWAAPNDGPGATFSFSIPRRLPGATASGDLDAARTPAVPIAEHVTAARC